LCRKYGTYDFGNILTPFSVLSVMQLAVAFLYCQLQVSFNDIKVFIN
jgi:hypothetical protein